MKPEEPITPLSAEEATEIARDQFPSASSEELARIVEDLLVAVTPKPAKSEPRNEQKRERA